MFKLPKELKEAITETLTKGIFPNHTFLQINSILLGLTKLEEIKEEAKPEKNASKNN